MNYLELVRKFWDFNQKNPIGGTAVSVYLLLLDLWNENAGKDFKISDAEICKILNITRPTVISSRRKLLNSGLLQYETQNGMPIHYKILTDYSPIVNIEKPKKPKPENKKQIQNIEEPPKPKEQHENLFSKIIPPETPSTDNHQRTTNFKKNIPTAEEFLEYAKTLEIYAPELDYSIMAKYESWVENGWKNGYNKPITNWKLTLKNTLPYLKNSSVQNSHLKNIPTINRPKSTYNE